MMYPLVLELAATDALLRVPVTVTCRVLGFSTKAFYKWRADPVCARDLDDAYLTNAAVDLHTDDPEFGYRLIADDLKAAGHLVSENRIWRLCSAQRLWSVHSKKRGLNRKPGPPVHDDLLQRDFTAIAADVVWLTDITEHPTNEGKLYLCAVKDVFSNRIVGYSIDSRMKSSLAVAALANAVTQRTPHATIVHSDRGSQGEFNWSSQHLDHGGVGWDDRGSRCRRRRPGRDGSGPRIGRCGRRCARRAAQSRRELCNGSSGA
jgi:putative transposase